MGIRIGIGGLKIGNSGVAPWTPLTIALAGTGSDQTNYILPVNVHYGVNNGDVSSKNIFMNKGCKNDFSDVYFTAADGVTKLTHYLANHGNYEIIPTTLKLGIDNFVLANGSILARDVFGYANGVFLSANNGVSWTQIYNGTNSFIYADSRGYIYTVSDNSLLKRSIDNGAHWTTVLDMSAVGGYIRAYGMDEDSNGKLFFGRYQGANGAAVFRSTDSGANWATCWTDAVLQHVHGLRIDLSNNYIYAGVDCTTQASQQIIRSIDGGDNWTVLRQAAGSDVTGIYCGSGFRLFGSGAGGAVMGSTIIRTTDDITFTPVLNTNQVAMGIKKVGSYLYATGNPYFQNRYPQIYRSADDGVTWETIWIHGFDRFDEAGLFHLNTGTPTGESAELGLIGKQDGDFTYPNSRLYVGGTHYQATFYVKIPSLPNVGTTIIAKIKGNETSVQTIFGGLVASNLVVRYKLDEGLGTAIVDSGGSSKNGVLTAGTGSWNASGGRRAGSRFPHVVLSGKSYHFTGDGYIKITNSGNDVLFQFTKNFTYCCWMRSTNVGTTQMIMSKGYWGSKCGLATGNSRGNLIFMYKDAGGNEICDHADVDAFGGLYSVCDGRWHHVGVVVDNAATPNAYFYIDGELWGAQALSGTPLVNTAVFIIGGEEDTNMFIGDIDDVQCYNTALTELQLRSIYEDRPVGTIESAISI